MTWIHNKLQRTKLSNASPCTCNLLSFLWCPNVVGPCNVSHNRLGDPNSSYANIGWFDHLSSMSIHLVLPKLSNIILNKFCVKQITVSAILAHMPFCSTSVANSVLKLDEGALDFIIILLSITSLLEWKSGLCGLLDGSCSSSGLDRSDRSGVTGLTGLNCWGQQWVICPFFLHPKHILFSGSFLWLLESLSSSSGLIWQFLHNALSLDIYNTWCVLETSFLKSCTWCSCDLVERLS